MAYSGADNDAGNLAAENSHLITRIENLIKIGIALSAENNTECLLEKILIEAQNLTNADAGTLYLINEQNRLSFQIMRTRSLGIELGGSTGRPIELAPISLYDAHGEPNNRAVSAAAALTGETINIEDAYTAVGFDFSGTKAYDEKIGYRSKSFLTLPMKNHENRIIGVLQLINAIDPASQEIRSFSREDQHLAEALASQAAVALTNQHLLEDLRVLLEKFIEVIATAIDEKSPYTGGHCRRVPEIAMRLAAAVHDADKGPFADLRFSDEELYELKIAALLHDCGKITTPVHVVDKGTKLETIYNRIELIETRFAILKKQAEIDYLQRLAAGEDRDAVTQDYQHSLQALDGDLTFLQRANIGGEFMSEEDQSRVHEIAKRQFTDHTGKQLPVLSEEEVYNLTIPKGTLTPEEREIINYHIVSTINMLEKLPFPKHLRNVPEIAGGHHETMDGAGYPRGLTREQMSVQARIMGIADIFEALTAADRPYKKAMPVSRALEILGRMKNNNHIDPDLFDIFIHEKVYEHYARDFLAEEQLDTVDLDKLPGYRPL